MHKILLCIFFWWITIFLFSAFCTIKIVGVCLGWGVNCNNSSVQEAWQYIQCYQNFILHGII